MSSKQHRTCPFQCLEGAYGQTRVMRPPIRMETEACFLELLGYLLGVEVGSSIWEAVAFHLATQHVTC